MYLSRTVCHLIRTLHRLPVKARINTKLLVSVFSVSIQNSVPPYISDFLHPYCPSRTLRSLDTSLLTVPCLDPLSGIHNHYPSEKQHVLQLLKRNLRLIYFTFICAEVHGLSFCMYHSGGMCVCVSVCVCVCVCVCLCLCVCVCVIISLYGWGYLCVRWYGIWVLWGFFHCLVGSLTPVGHLECLIYMCFVFLYLHLFRATEHVSHGRAL